jgi:uncharacterized protein YkwD
MRPRRRPTAALAALLALAIAMIAAPPASAATTATVGSQLVGWVNQARADRGLRALRVDPRVSSLATERAQRLADAGFLSHSYPGDPGAQLDARSIQWWRWGEVLAWSGATFGTPAASYIFQGWRNSPSHWSVLMSADFNYLGTGIAVRGADGATYASIVLTESLDRTPPVPKMLTATRYSTTVLWSYKGWEPPLQTHTAGMRDFDVQYRMDDGSWQTIRSATTYASVRLYARARGHWHSVRVRARDRRGNVSAWTTEMRVWVP